MAYPIPPRRRKPAFGGRDDGKRPAAIRAAIGAAVARPAIPVAQTKPPALNKGPVKVVPERNRSPFSRRYDINEQAGPRVKSERRDFVRSLVGKGGFDELQQAMGIGSGDLAALLKQRRQLRSRLDTNPSDARGDLLEVNEILKPALQARRDYLQQLFQSRARRNDGVRSQAPGVNEPQSNRRNGFQGVGSNRRVNTDAVGEEALGGFYRGRSRRGVRRGRYQGVSRYPR